MGFRRRFIGASPTHPPNEGDAMNRKFSVLLVLTLLAGLLLVPATAGAEWAVSDGPRDTSAPKHSHRLIVELSSPPLAVASAEVAAAGAAGGGKLDVSTPGAQATIQQLKAEQAVFMAALGQVVPGARAATVLNEQGQQEAATYQILLNAVAVDAGRNVDVDQLRRQIAKMPGVKAVHKDFAHQPALYASLPLISAAAAWDDAAIGGKNNAGAGIKVASMDGGLHHEAPMFDGTGYAYPPGYPLGDNRNNNGKIIVSRAYFRTWDPPSAGDENPWPGTQGTSHGTHTGSTAAGNEVTVSYLGAPPVTISGVAPKSYVMSYRVFYNSITDDGSFYNTEGLMALEDIVADGADVLNNSWGGGPGSIGGEYDALDLALINAVKAGIFVSMSAGNAGPGIATSDHPSDDYISVAASSSGGTFGSGKFNVTAPEPVPSNLLAMPFAAATFGAPILPGTVLGPYAYLPASAVDAANANGCAAFPAGAFAGKAAMIVRGTCEFGVKVLNAEQAGALFTVIYNHAAGGDGLINMGPGAVGGQVTISSIFIGRTNGLALVDWYTANPGAAQFALDTKAFQVGNTPDVLASFSSRGPGVGNVLKPDITAPGVNILAQGYDQTATGEARHLGFGQASGTSMAAPHVTGAGALLKQIHPDWSPAWIKSALMSSSKYLEIYNHDGSPAQPLDMGAGRLDLTNAADPGVILDPPSLSFGVVTRGDAKTIEVAVTSVAASAQTYNVSTLDTRLGFGSLQTLAGVSFDPAVLTLNPGETKVLKVTWDSATAGDEGDQQGFVTLKSAGYDAHLPAWVRIGYAPKPVVIGADVTLEAGKDYTVVAVGELATIEPLVLLDDNSAPEAGKAKVRFVHASPDAPPVDVAVKNGPVIFANVAFKGVAGYSPVSAGTYDLEVRPAGTNQVALALPGVKFDADKIYTVFAMGRLVGTEDKLTAVAVVDEPSSPPAGSSRVRVAHAVPGAPPVSLFVNDQVAFFNVAYEDVTGYKTLPAGTYSVAVKPALGQVLIIDNDGSESLGLPDYTPHYADALAALGVTFEVWDADFNAGADPTMPDANYLAQYKTIIYQTGDNFRPNGTFTVPTPPTTLDMDRLVEFANNGGSVIAFGQDLASVTNGTSSSSAHFFYSSLLGATYVQDSVNGEEIYEDGVQPITGLPRTPFFNKSFDISATGDGAGNQGYVDEIKVGCYEPNRPQDCGSYAPILKYSIGTYILDQGTVGLAHRDAPSLERPGVSFAGDALYFSFGLEGVNNDTGLNPREDLLASALAWGWDEASVAITPTVNPAGQVSYFVADMDSEYGGEGTLFRWDFGDGSPFTNGFTSATAGHTYAAPGTYTVRVEATNTLGTVAIGSVEITVGSGFTTPVTKTFEVGADTAIGTGSPTTNSGTGAYLYVRSEYVGSGLPGLERSRSLVQFDVSTIGLSYPVDNATLMVYLDAFSGGGSVGDLTAYAVTTPWGEMTATWNAPWAAKGGDFMTPAGGSSPISSADVGKWVKVDVTSIVQKWVDGQPNNGLILRLENPTSTSQFRFVSRNHWFGDTSAPKLEVTYRMP
jgi:hypothetical protein